MLLFRSVCMPFNPFIMMKNISIDVNFVSKNIGDLSYGDVLEDKPNDDDEWCWKETALSKALKSYRFNDI